MPFALREEEPAFLTTAPTILSYTTDIAVPRAEVFAAVSGDPASWRHWFPGFRDGGYDSPPPHGVGAARWVRVAGAGTYRETIIVWEEPRQWAWRVDSTTLPIARALVEDWSLDDAGSATTVTWTFAVDALPWFGLGLRVAPGTMNRLFLRAMRNLERRLQR